MKVLKFGGSSVQNAERIANLIQILHQYRAQTTPFAVVFSAMGGITDLLISAGRLAEEGKPYEDALFEFANRHRNAADELLPNHPSIQTFLNNNLTELNNLLYGVSLTREMSLRTQDLILSFGERTANFLIATVLQERGFNAAYLDARKVVRTNTDFGNAKVDFATTNRLIQAHFEANANTIQIITGFIGSTDNGLTTTLGRGGSDYTAAIFAAALHAEVLEIWTDVDGVMTADPRKVNTAFSIPTMSYAEAMEMSHFGAKVIYPPTIQPILTKGIPLRILNSFNPTHQGTLITNAPQPAEHPIRGISSISRVTLFTLEGSGLIGVVGSAARLFSTLAKRKINVTLITQGSSEHSITFAVLPTYADATRIAIQEEFSFEMERGLIDDLRENKELSVIAVIGENMKSRSGLAGQVFGALGKNGINIIAIAQGSSELNISAVIPAKDEVKALKALHEGFFANETTVLHVFMIGVGLIGSTLLAQIEKQADFLKEKHRMQLQIVGFSNSKKMIFNENGINITNWRQELEDKGQAMSIKEFVFKMRDLNLPNSIFIDNTANTEVAAWYATILDSSISISTPNKIGASSDLATYNQLKTLAKKRKVLYCYETNVGAGLPVINTLNDLIASGDRILKIEGVLSGTLSFIFNNFDTTKQFSAIVREAKELGYTEPDPREDLSGADVRRKLLILAREAGVPLEADDIVIKGLLSDEAVNAPTIDDFLAQLEKEDTNYTQLAQTAQEKGKVLRFVAALEGEDASISLKEYELSHPFASLSGSDNMIVFTTERYRERPLVIRGPGAGAEVTAAGVFAEILRIGHYLA